MHQFRSFGEYAEYVSPDMYDHQKIKSKIQLNEAQQEMLLAQRELHRRKNPSGMKSGLSSNNKSSNRSKSQIDLLGFTTQNRPSVYQNASILNQSRKKPNENKQKIDIPDLGIQSIIQGQQIYGHLPK